MKILHFILCYTTNRIACSNYYADDAEALLLVGQLASDFGAILSTVCIVSRFKLQRLII